MQKQNREARKGETKAKKDEKGFCTTFEIHVRRDYLFKHCNTFSHKNPSRMSYIDALIEEKYPNYEEHLREQFREKYQTVEKQLIFVHL
jgi:hypothetical protein